MSDKTLKYFDSTACDNPFTCKIFVFFPPSRSISPNFYARGLKGPPWASSVWIVCLSICLSISLRNSIPLTNKVQYLKFGWSYSNQTWTVSHLRVAHISLASHAPGVVRGQNVGLRVFCHILTLLPPGASVFHKHMSILLSPPTTPSSKGTTI